MTSRPSPRDPHGEIDEPAGRRVVIGLLGPVTVSIDGRDVPLPAGRGIELLARLAVSAPRPVPAEVLVDGLWGREEPANPANALQGLVARLRRALARSGVPGSVIETVGGGYRLRGVVTDLDLVDELLDAADESHPERRLALVVDALAMWRGHPLADVRYREWAQPHVRRAEALVWRARDARIEAQLDLGHVEQVIAELEAATVEEPQRERAWELLMLALYRLGRQADALATYQSARSHLREELGVEPGPALVAMESAILRQDPQLLPDATDHRRRTNLTTPISRLVGRESELAAVSELVAANRLVVIVGAGGVGKTRLAVEVAHRLRSTTFADADVWFVDLASVTSGDDVDEALASTLRVQDSGATADVRELVESSLAARPALVVLDNCEHLVEPVADLVEGLLGSCPDLRVLATSREVLPVIGSVAWPLGPMGPDDAVQLFVERVADVAPGRRLDDEELHSVAAICRRLDRLPLAIELAAARVRVLSIQEILERLDDRFELLTRGSRPALGRRQTLRAVIDWSYDLLFSDEQRVFERLSVFVGDFDLRAAEAVATAGGTARADVVTILGRLVEKSLVTARSDRRPSRFRMLESLAEYGRMRLDERGELESALDAHAAHAVAVAARSAEALRGDRQLDFLTTVRDSRSDLVAAFERLQRVDRSAALDLAGNLGWTWWVSGRVREGIGILERALAAVPDDHDPDRWSWAAAWFAYLSFLVGDAGTAERADRAEELLAQIEQPSKRSAYTASLLSEIHAVGGAPERGARLAETALLHAVRSGDDGPHLDYVRGRAALHQGEWAAAERSFAAATTGLADVDEHVIRALALASLGELAERRGDHDAAIRHARGAVRCVQATGFPTATASLTARHGMTLLAAGHLDAAESELRDALCTAREVGFPPTVLAALSGLATVAVLRGDVGAAEAAARDALDVATHVALHAHVVNAHCILVGCALEQGSIDVAVEHARAAEASAEHLGDPRWIARARLAVARTLTMSSAAEDRVRGANEIGSVSSTWRRHGLVPSAIERAELADAEHRAADPH